MLLPAVVFWQVILAVHIIVVVAAFGVLIAYPLIATTAERLDRRSVPLLHRVRLRLARSLIQPGLLVVVLAGVYLSIKLHQWHEFYVQWGIGAVIVLGALEGAFMVRASKQLADLAERDIAGAGGGDVTWSTEYLGTRTRADQIGAVMSMIVIVTIFFMVVQ